LTTFGNTFIIKIKSSIEGSEKVFYSLSLRERVGVRDSQNQAIAGVSLLLA
jgi:hypothetical protein